MQYCLPQIPSVYWINKTRYRCNACGNAFELYTSNGNEVVKFVESKGKEIRWLPMHGQGGYLDLFEKFMPGFLATGKQIIPPIVSQFLNQLQIHIEPSESGNGFEMSNDNRHCPRCKNQDVKELGEEILSSPEVLWLKIDCELLK
jgi:rubredoxin